jgi:hypothetical protein
MKVFAWTFEWVHIYEPPLLPIPFEVTMCEQVNLNVLDKLDVWTNKRLKQQIATNYDNSLGKIT